jgi:hypothetical protein
MDFVMRPLVISVIAATLVGCSCYSPQQHAQQALLTACAEANGFACSDGDTGALEINSKPLVLRGNSRTEKAIAAKESPRYHRKANTRTKNAKSNIVQKTDASSSVQPDDKSNPVINAKSTIAAKTETPQSTQLDDGSEIEKAKGTIAAKMKNPAVEFVELKRIAEKDALGKSSIDIICGYVGEKNASGEPTGDRPFLYLVQKNEAYIGDMMATTDAYKYLANCLANGRN